MPIPVDMAARVALAPLLIAQALGVRRSALKLPEPPGPRSGETGQGAPLRLFIVGDSSAAGVGADAQSDALSGRLTSALSDRFHVNWVLEARTGATTKQTLAILRDRPVQPFDVAVVALGVNDITRAVPRRRWMAQQNDLIAVLRDRFSVEQILVSGVPPMGHFPLLPQPLRWVLGAQAQRFDIALADMLRDTQGARHVPVAFPVDPKYAARDGFHPSPAAYAEWARHLADLIDQPSFV